MEALKLEVLAPPTQSPSQAPRVPGTELGTEDLGPKGRSMQVSCLSHLVKLFQLGVLEPWRFCAQKLTVPKYRKK